MTSLLNLDSSHAPGLESKAFSGGDGTSFFGPHPEIGQAIAGWTKQTALEMGNFVQDHPYRIGLGIVAAAVTHRLGGGPALSGAVLSIVGLHNFGAGPTTIDWNSIKSLRSDSKQF